MESIARLSLRFINTRETRFLRTPILGSHRNHNRPHKPGASSPDFGFKGTLIGPKNHCPSSVLSARAGWFLGFGGDKKPMLPEIVKAGDPVLHEAARDVAVDEIGSEKIERIIEDMIRVMRNAPGVGLAAPQIGVPLKIIVLEDTKEYISICQSISGDMDAASLAKRQGFGRSQVVLNPKLKKKNNKTALFFEGCLSVDGFRAVVERHLEVEVTGLSRDGQPIKIDASGWQARILQHECDHLDGTIYVDKMVPRTFRTVENLDLPLPNECPKLGVGKLA
ncbi:hypothetical protein Scep_008432 [Stephania cephalantha]|uniref:Peptide deformylase n=1 Tax=Stephania cephalantha TaxID=152367 RepID=A0AAP0KCW0_9MAGN